MILKAIVMASLSIPVMIYLLFIVIGIVFFVTQLIHTGELSSNSLGMLFAGNGYAFIALIISSVPTFVLGYPISLYAHKKGFLSKKVILIGSPVIGGLYLSIASIIYITNPSLESLLWIMLIGCGGGLFNGYIFMRCLKPNNTVKFARKKHGLDAAQKDAPHPLP